MISQYQVIKRFGDWLVFSGTDSSYTYVNLNKAVKFSTGDEDPIVINNQILLGRTKIPGVGYRYTLYDTPGCYVTPLYRSINPNDGWELQSESKSLIIHNEGDLPSMLPTSILSAYRRNVLPETLEGFKLIGSIGGIIFYRIGNLISYL